MRSVHDHGGDGDGDAADAQSVGVDGMASGLVISVEMSLAKMKVMVLVVIVLVTMMIKMKADSSFFSGSFQNLSPPRRPGHPCAPKTVPPAGCPGASGVPGPHLYHPSIRPAAQGPQWEGNISRVLTSTQRYRWAAESGHNSTLGNSQQSRATRQKYETEMLLDGERAQCSRSSEKAEVSVRHWNNEEGFLREWDS